MEIERDIAKVNTDIEAVTKEIKAVTDQIKVLENILEKEYEEWTQTEKNKYGNHSMLREKENKLREKENKLRDEKNKLMEILAEKEKQRTHEMDTFNNILNNSLPKLETLDSTTNNKTGTAPTYPRDCGRTFQEWATFTEEVDEFCNSSIITNCLSSNLGKKFTFDEGGCRNEMDVHHRILNNYGLPLKALLKDLGISSDFERPGGDNQVLFDPDIAWKIKDNENSALGLVIEVKPWWSFDIVDNVVERYKQDTEQSNSPDSKLVKALQQIYGYMSYNYMRYGILTTYTCTYFLRRKGESTLCISKSKKITTNKS